MRRANRACIFVAIPRSRRHRVHTPDWNFIVVIVGVVVVVVVVVVIIVGTILEIRVIRGKGARRGSDEQCAGEKARNGQSRRGHVTCLNFDGRRSGRSPLTLNETHTLAIPPKELRDRVCVGGTWRSPA